MTRRGKAGEDTQAVLERLRRESFSGEAALDDLLGDAPEDASVQQPPAVAAPPGDDGERTASAMPQRERKGEEATQKPEDEGDAPAPRQSAAELLQDLLEDEAERQKEMDEDQTDTRRLAMEQRGLVQSFFETWFSPEGRMGKTLFALHFVGVLLAGFLLGASIFGAAAIVLAWLGEGRGLPSESISLAAGFAAVFLVSVPLLALLLVFLRAGMRRWHDLGYGDTAWLLLVVCPFLLIALAGEACWLITFLQLPSLLGIASDSVLLHSAWPFGGTVLALFGVLHLYMFFAEGDFSSNAAGPFESAGRLRPHIGERPELACPFFQSMMQFKGRMNRKRFLLRLLFLLFFICLLVFVVLETAERLPPFLGADVALYGTCASVALAFFLPTGIMVQRLHDIGRSGWFVGVPLFLVLAFIVRLALAHGDITFLAREPFGLEILAAAFLVEVYEVFLFVALIFVKGPVRINVYGDSCLKRL